MRKFLFFIIFLISADLFALGTFVNKFGGCADEDGTNFEEDLVIFQNGKKTQSHFADTADLTIKTEYLTGSAIFSINDKIISGETKNTVKIEGYGQFSPLSFLSIVAGNKTKGKFALEGGKMYTTPGAFLMQANPFVKGVGLVYNQTLSIVNILATASITPDADLCFDAGLQLKFNNMFSIGSSATNILNNNDCIHYSVFGTFHYNNFSASLGYINNYNNRNINTIEKVNLSNQNYLPAPSSHVIKVSALYSVDRFSISFDYLMGLTDNYNMSTEMKSIKNKCDYCISNGINPSLLGITDVEYSKQLGKNASLPVYIAVKTGFKINQNVLLNLKYSLSYLNKFENTVYPYVECKFGKNAFRGGLRVIFDSDNNVKYAIPLMWTFGLDF